MVLLHIICFCNEGNWNRKGQIQETDKTWSIPYPSGMHPLETTGNWCKTQTQSKTTPCSTFPIISWVPQRRWLKASSKIALRIGNLIRQIQVAKLHWRQWDLYKGRFCNGKSNTGTEKSCTLNKEVFQVNLNTSHRFVLKQFPPCPANKNWTWTTSAKSVTLCEQSHKRNSLQSYSIIDNWDINVKWYF